MDFVLCDGVLERLEEPEKLSSETRRVLRDGGHLCIPTTNASGCVGILAGIVPERWHARITRRVQERRDESDIFPTTYPCNSLRKVRAAGRRHGLDAVVYGYDAEVSYLQFSRLAYWLD